ncbi:dihydrolipoyl dehydrogenase [Henriciella aquimarina]|uniref:dihydrolipoyl dehydrogenase n=1 Tax=Henriciella aquimarina TaxID=545261 RepID=UPI000A051685|nr:dihydrolipoyl dehydrogenase [Henriciella aquimarina]
MADIQTDVAIIGAGTAGLAAERHARDSGAQTLLIDPYFAGTTCATVGCMPSKLLIAAGNAAHNARTAEGFGIHLPEPEIDGPAVMQRLQAQRDRFVDATKESIAGLPDGVCLKARAHFTGPTSLALDDGRIVQAKAVVITTGAHPVIPKPFKPVEGRIITNETLFDRPDLPRSVGVIGAGPLGLEMAQALARLGVRVEVFDMGETLAGLPEGAVEASLREALGKEMPLHLGVEPEAEQAGDGVRLRWSGAETGEATFDHLLVAAGRAPNLDGLALEAAGLALDDHGAPVFDADTMQCGDAPIFIAGDANHDQPVLHEASAEGTIAGVNAAGFPQVQPMRRKIPLQIMFTEPNMAVVGTPGADGDVCGQTDYADQGRAKAMRRNQGVCEIFADARDGRLTGARLAGPDIEHLAHLLTWEMHNRTRASDLLEKPFYHPTLEEGLKPALQQICKAVAAPAAPERDDGFLPGAS